VICTRLYASIKNIDLIELLRNVFYVGIWRNTLEVIIDLYHISSI
jgi:hypothetical protein